MKRAVEVAAAGGHNILTLGPIPLLMRRESRLTLPFSKIGRIALFPKIQPENIPLTSGNGGCSAGGVEPACSTVGSYAEKHLHRTCESGLWEGWLRRDVVRAASKRNTLTANED